MASTGFIICGSGSSVSGPNLSWGVPGNITASDGTYTGVAASVNSDTNYLKASNFGLTVPDGSTIDGIQARIRAVDDLGVARITGVIVGKSDTALGSNLESSYTTISSTPSNYDYGSSTEKWGLTWSAADVRSSTFQVRVMCNCYHTVGMQSGNPRVDAIWIDVFYTENSSMFGSAVLI